MKLNARQLRRATGNRVQETVKKQDIYIILDNVLDTYNIGSIFRLADAVAAKKVYLCGQSEIPPNHRIKKASINTTEWVTWEYAETAVEAIAKITSEVKKMPASQRGKQLHLGGASRVQIIAIEQSTKSVPYDEFNYTLPVCLVVGNETTGVSKEVLQSRMLDGIVEIPMFGVNRSLNVVVSLGIILYQVIEDKALFSYKPC